MIEQLIQGLQNSDPAAATAALADDVTLHVAVHDEPFAGKETTAAILTAVLDGVFTNIEVTETIESPGHTVIMFDLDVVNYPRRAQGLLTVKPDQANRIQEIVVFLRPLAALAEVAAEMGRKLGGPAPEGGQ